MFQGTRRRSKLAWHKLSMMPVQCGKVRGFAYFDRIPERGPGWGEFILVEGGTGRWVTGSEFERLGGRSRRRKPSVTVNVMAGGKGGDPIPLGQFMALRDTSSQSLL